MADEKAPGYATGFIQGYKSGYAAAKSEDNEPVGDVKLHFVQAGDTLTYLAEHFDTTVEELVKLNPTIDNPDLIYEGDILRVA